jgi:hypothetical protein
MKELKIQYLMRRIVSQKKTGRPPLHGIAEALDEAHSALLEGYGLLHENYQKDSTDQPFDTFLKRENRRQLQVALSKIQHLPMRQGDLVPPLFERLQRWLQRCEQALYFHTLGARLGMMELR